MAVTARTVRIRAQKKAERDFGDRALEWRRLVAEFWGTFLLVLASAGATVANSLSPADFPLSIVKMGSGLMTMAAIYFMGSVSGAHLNPAVSFAFALRRNFPWGRVPGYVVAQLLGGLAAAALLKALFGMTANIGATLPKLGVTDVQAFVLETVLTAGLVNTILGTASGARNIGTNAGIAVGGYIALAGLWASGFTGASMNPARSLGPDIVRGDFSHTWLYVAGPLLGAGIGVAFEWLLKGPPTKSGNEAAQGSGN